MIPILKKLTAAGIDQKVDVYSRKYIRLLNEMALIFCISDLVFMIIFIFMGSAEMAFYLLILNLLFISVPFLNHFKKYTAARVLLISSLYVGIWFFSTTIGKDSLIDIIYVSVLTVPFAISPRRQSVLIYTSLFLSIALFWFFRHTQLFEPLQFENAPVQIRYPITFFIFIMSFLVLNQMKKSQDKYEDLLENRAAEIDLINEKLQSTNHQLEHLVKELKHSMNEREILLREVHHRVKNNMQIINSLLSLQSKYTEEHRAQSILKYSQHRINSMAMVHEMLYKSENFSEISCRSYMNTLIQQLIHSMSANDQEISFSLNTPNETMSFEIAIPLGLLVNEIITNSIKHGFREGREGSIYLDMRKENEECVILIGDNGIGFQGQPSEYKEDSLGMLLITNLVGQLNGTLLKKETDGTHYEIRFKTSVVMTT